MKILYTQKNQNIDPLLCVDSVPPPPWKRTLTPEEIQESANFIKKFTQTVIDSGIKIKLIKYQEWTQ